MVPFTIATPFLLLLLLLVPILYVVAIKLRRRPTTHHNLPPGRSGWPIIGESLELLGANSEGIPEKFVLDRVKRYGSHVFRTSLMGEPTVILCGPAGNKLLFSSEGRKVALWWPASVRRTIGPSLISKSGEEAMAQKKMLMTFFNLEGLVKWIPTIDDVTGRHLATRWHG